MLSRGILSAGPQVLFQNSGEDFNDLGLNIETFQLTPAESQYRFVGATDLEAGTCQLP